MTGKVEWAVGNSRAESREDAHWASAGDPISMAVPERWTGAVTVTATPEARAALQHDFTMMAAAEAPASSTPSLEEPFVSTDAEYQEPTLPAASRPGTLRLVAMHERHMRSFMG